MSSSKADIDTSVLVTRAQAGSRAAMAELHRRFAPMVHAIVLAHRQHSDAADLTQQAFVTAIRRIGSLRDPAAFGPWLGQIARNTTRDHLRRRRPQAELTQHEPAVAAEGPARVEVQRVLAVIRTLPEQQAEMLMMRLLEGMTGPEIAARTGMKPGAVRVALHRGLAKLRDQLNDDRSSA